MAGSSGVDESQFKGLSRYFNSVTEFGRRNIAAATLTTVAVGFLFFKLKPKKTTVPTTETAAVGKKWNQNARKSLLVFYDHQTQPPTTFGLWIQLWSPNDVQKSCHKIE